MSIVAQRPRRGPIPLGKRPIPMVEEFLPPTQRLQLPQEEERAVAREVPSHLRAYLQHVVNPSMIQMERYIVAVLKHDHFSIRKIRYASQLPAPVQREIYAHWSDRPRHNEFLQPASATVVGVFTGLNY